ncbi:MAG TPA: hypothetical protein VJ991_10300, partial [Balneolales bacterium]|nr:hypothetical protein [Balneolales bacterium]
MSYSSGACIIKTPIGVINRSLRPSDEGIPKRISGRSPSINTLTGNINGRRLPHYAPDIHRKSPFAMTPLLFLLERAPFG